MRQKCFWVAFHKFQFICRFWFFDTIVFINSIWISLLENYKMSSTSLKALILPYFWMTYLCNVHLDIKRECFIFPRRHIIKKMHSYQKRHKFKRRLQGGVPHSLGYKAMYPIQGFLVGQLWTFWAVLTSKRGFLNVNT